VLLERVALHGELEQRRPRAALLPGKQS